MSGEALPRARIRRRRLFRLVWIVPALAAAVTAYFVWDHLRKLGPEISIRFSDASGVRAGQTPIIYRGVPVGEVIDVAPHARPRPGAGARAPARAGRAARIRRCIVLDRAAAGEPQPGDWSFHRTERPRDSCAAGKGRGGARGIHRRRIAAGRHRASGLAPRAARRASGRDPGQHAGQLSRGRGRRGAADRACAQLLLGRHPRPDLQPLRLPRARRLGFLEYERVQATGSLLKGIELELESLRTLFTGAIEFATPSEKAQRVPPGTVFFLHDKPREEWLNWSPRIPLAQR